MSNIHKQLAPVRHPITNNCTSWAPGSLAIYARPVDRWARIAARGSHALDRSRRIAGPLRRAAARAGRFPVIGLGISGRGPLGVFYAFFTGHKKTRRPLLAGGRY